MATKHTKKKKVVTKDRTLGEFRAWLEGVEELQGDDWHPDAEQWKLIRAAIDGIVEEEPEIITVSAPSPAPSYSRPVDSIVSAPIQYPRPVSAMTSVIPGIPDNLEISPAARAAMSGKLPTAMVPDASGKLKTPNIDTMNGDYNSGFE